MKQRQVASNTAESYTFGVELEVLVPRRKVQEVGINIGIYHHGHPLPAPFPQGWTAEWDASLHTSRPGYVPAEVVSPILQGRAASSRSSTWRRC